MNTLVGVILLFAGLAYDAFLHGADPMLATNEGPLSLSNTGHRVFLLGMVLLTVGVVGIMGRQAARVRAAERRNQHASVGAKGETR